MQECDNFEKNKWTLILMYFFHFFLPKYLHSQIISVKWLITPTYGLFCQL